MGALHEGHASLLRIAREKTDSVALSIFVNPTQFGVGEDFEKYPRTWESDLATAEREGVTAVFAPRSDFYPEGYRTVVTVPGWNTVLEGEIRPGHFDGVTSVVTKLFHAAECDVAVFGQKDAQQALLVRRMVRDLDFGLELVVAPIVREADGLALSSRNRYLTETERSRALAVSRAVFAAQHAWEAGKRLVGEIRQAGLREFERTPPDVLDYFTILDPDTLKEWADEDTLLHPAILVTVARYGTTRLLDNAVLGPVWG
jgi:pantoate--beta-alanine ligase